MALLLVQGVTASPSLCLVDLGTALPLVMGWVKAMTYHLAQVVMVHLAEVQGWVKATQMIALGWVATPVGWAVTAVGWVTMLPGGWVAVSQASLAGGTALLVGWVRVAAVKIP
jgi:hypothetical protein